MTKFIDETENYFIMDVTHLCCDEFNSNTYAEYAKKPWIVTTVDSTRMVHMAVIAYDHERIT
jgi:hypothetical protein